VRNLVLTLGEIYKTEDVGDFTAMSLKYHVYRAV